MNRSGHVNDVFVGILIILTDMVITLSDTTATETVKVKKSGVEQARPLQFLKGEQTE